MPIMIETLKAPELDREEWMGWDEQAISARLSHYPSLDNVPFPVGLQ
ncbi:MAG: hypothetical protein ACMZ63_07410 [Methylotenera sp.]